MLIIVGEVNLVVKSNLIGLFISIYRSIFVNFVETDYVYLENLDCYEVPFFYNSNLHFSSETLSFKFFCTLFFVCYATS